MIRPLVVGLVAVSLLTACAGDTPEVPVGPDGEPDPVLVAGRDVYTERCANCHGSSGGGDRGPRLSDGATLEKYPDTEDQVELVREGKGNMPGFGGRLDDEELVAVVRFVREVL